MKTFVTDDLALATYLTIQGFEYKGIEMKDRRFAQWVFDETAELMNEFDIYDTESALVEPLKFCETLADVRSKMFSFVNQETGRSARPGPAGRANY